MLWDYVINILMECLKNGKISNYRWKWKMEWSNNLKSSSAYMETLQSCSVYCWQSFHLTTNHEWRTWRRIRVIRRKERVGKWESIEKWALLNLRCKNKNILHSIVPLKFTEVWFKYMLSKCLLPAWFCPQEFSSAVKSLLPSTSEILPFEVY